MNSFSKRCMVSLDPMVYKKLVVLKEMEHSRSMSDALDRALILAGILMDDRPLPYEYVNLSLRGDR
jgi:hypothetical protein